MQIKSQYNTRMRAVILLSLVLFYKVSGQFFDDINIKIWIGDSPMVLVQADTLSHREDITEIEIDEQNITQLLNSTFHNLPKIKRIKIQHTGLEFIETGTFGVLPKIRTINLNFNALRNITKGVFNKLNLTQFTAVGNSIAEIREGAFDNIPNLEKLDLSRNQIEVLAEKIFRNTGHLKEINLSRNRIATIPDYFFRDAFAKSVDYRHSFIDLSENRLGNYVNSAVLQGVWGLNSLNMEKNRIQGMGRDILKTFRYLDRINLSGNRMVFLARGILKELQNTSEIQLGENPWECLFVRDYKLWSEKYKKANTIDVEIIDFCSNKPNNQSVYDIYKQFTT